MLRTSRKASSCAAVIVVSMFIGLSPAAADVKKDHTEQRRHIKKRAVSAIGTPYSYGGTTTSGFDCSGFTRWVFTDHGADLPRSSADQWSLRKLDDHERIWKRKNLEKGDLVFHKTTDAPVGHVGIYVGRGKFVSATSSGGVQRTSIWDPYYWGPRWVGAVRVPATQAQ